MDPHSPVQQPSRHTRQAHAQATPASSPVASPAADNGVLVSSVEGVPNAYTKYPEQFKTVEQVPGKGGEVTVFALSYSPPPTPRDENSYWQELENRLGVRWTPTLISREGYDERLATTFASGDIPDLMYLMRPAERPVAVDAIEQGAFFDLTDIVESDQLADYPNLAAFPKYMWDATRHQGKIWGVPKPVLRNNDPVWYRADWLNPLGLSALNNADTFRNYVVGVSTNDPDNNGNSGDTFGLTPKWGNWEGGILDAMFHVPMNWQLHADGTLTSSVETEELRRRVAFQAELYAEGAFHPDAAGLDATDVDGLIRSGRAAMSTGGFVSLFGPLGHREAVRDQVPSAILDPIIPPGADGGSGITYRNQGIFGYTAITAAADEVRVDELLQIINYLSAPFGSEEFTFIHYGLEGTHSEQTDDGGFELTPSGEADTGGLTYPFRGENFFYYPGMPDHAPMAQKHNEAMAEVAISDPTMGLISPTMGEHGAVLGQLVGDTISNIVMGREKLDDVWDNMVTQWRERGGDAARSDFEQALRDAGR